MRKKISVIVIALFTVVSTANAQFLRFGIKGGVTSSNVKFDDITNIQTSDNLKEFAVEQGNSKMGMQFGFFGRIQIVGFFIQPELLFAHSQGEVLLTDVTAGQVYKETQKFNKVDIPVMVGWKLGPARIGLGPVASIMLSESDGLKDKLTSLAGETTTNNFKNATFGYQVGVGLDILKKITLDVKYEGNLSKLGSGIKLGDTNYSFDQRNPQWIFSVGIFF
jgi:hypothetical protein